MEEIQAKLADRLKKIEDEFKLNAEAIQKASTERTQLDKKLAALRDRQLELRSSYQELKNFQGTTPELVQTSKEVETKQKEDFKEEVKKAKK